MADTMFIRKGRLFKFTFLLFFLLFFSACIEYDEEIKIFPNGWVRVSLDFRAPSMIFRRFPSSGFYPIFKMMMLSRDEAIKKLPSSFQIMEWYLDRSTANWEFHTNFYVKHVENNGNEMGKIFPDQKITVKIENGKIYYKRFIDLTKLGRYIAQMKESNLVKRELLVASIFRFKLVVPTRVIVTNAKIQNGRTLEWDYKLLYLVAQPQIMKAVFNTPSPLYSPFFWLFYAFLSMMGYILLVEIKL